MRTITALLAAFIASNVFGHTPNDPPHQQHCMGDLKLESGEAIKDFCISYVTHGTLNANKSNAFGKCVSGKVKHSGP